MAAMATRLPAGCLVRSPSSPITPRCVLVAAAVCLAVALVGALVVALHPYALTSALHFTPTAIASSFPTAVGRRAPPALLPGPPARTAAAVAVRAPLPAGDRRWAGAARWPRSAAMDDAVPGESQGFRGPDVMDDAAEGDPTLPSLVAVVGYIWLLLASVWMWLTAPIQVAPEGEADTVDAPVLAEGVSYERVYAADCTDPLVVHMCSYYGRRGNRWGSWVKKNLKELSSLHPAYQVGLINIITTMVLWKFPLFYPWFLAGGLRWENITGFLLSGFSCVNPIALINEVFFYYIVTRAYVSWWTRKEFWTLYVGGTVGASLLVLLQGTAYMGPTGGSAALLTAYALRNQESMVTIWPFVNLQVPLRNVGIAVAVLNAWLLFDGVAGSAAFLGGALFAFLQWEHYRRTNRFLRFRR